MKIKELSQENFSNVLELFDKDYPNLAFVYGIVDRILPGKIWVDNEGMPNVCLIMSNVPYCFIAGNLNKEIFEEFYNVLKEKELVKLVCESNQIDFSQYGFMLIPRLQYRYKLQEANIYENTSNYSLEEINSQETLNKCTWGAFIAAIYGNASNYLNSSMGFILWDPVKKQVASEAHAIIGKNLIEIGTITHENYRGQGLSTIVCNQVIRLGIKKGLHPIWTCDQSNVSSNKIAQHQGMDEVTSYIFHTLQKK